METKSITLTGNNDFTNSHNTNSELAEYTLENFLIRLMNSRPELENIPSVFCSETTIDGKSYNLIFVKNKQKSIRSVTLNKLIDYCDLSFEDLIEATLYTEIQMKDLKKIYLEFLISKRQKWDVNDTDQKDVDSSTSFFVYTWKNKKVYYKPRYFFIVFFG